VYLARLVDPEHEPAIYLSRARLVITCRVCVRPLASSAFTLALEKDLRI
jgi:hypothetical protein